MAAIKTVLYFGNVNMEQSRNKVYTEGLRQNGYKVLECIDRSPGLRKYWRLYRKHSAMKGKYDVLIVGYGGYVVVPLARLISRKPIIFDALCSFYETEILSRDALKEIPFRRLFVRVVDWLATRFAHSILVESNAQREYFIRELGVPGHKLTVVYTGVDDSVFRYDPKVVKYPRFTVLFRGRIMSEAGVPVVVRAAKLLEGEGIDFLLIGYGCNETMTEFQSVLKELSPSNVRYIGEHMPIEELVQTMQKCHVSLGQFADHERLERTIPHKCFESMSLKMPYVTARTEGVAEVLKEGTHCVMVRPNNPQELAQAILALSHNDAAAQKMADAAYQLYNESYRAQAIVAPLHNLLRAL